jgi:hypothetical protein
VNRIVNEIPLRSFVVLKSLTLETVSKDASMLHSHVVFALIGRWFGTSASNIERERKVNVR